jgi:7-cyano-7-deazaguanine reductase
MNESPLGKRSEYPEQYAPELLHGIPRAEARKELGLGSELPFRGVDVWNAYELSWLDERGKPVVGVGEFVVPADSGRLVESKSLKLYLGSLNGMRYPGGDALAELIRADLSKVCGAEVQVAIGSLEDSVGRGLQLPAGECIDAAELQIDVYEPDASLLRVADAGEELEETLHSNLLRSRCPVTGQPDWGTVLVRYRGPRIDRESLLGYVISFRNHQGFHEHCVERMWMDVMQRCAPSKLTLQAQYLRRGGLDINPFRSNFETKPEDLRLGRQ